MTKKHYLLVITLCWALISCSSTPPAPVTVLNSQPIEEPEFYQGETYTVKPGDTLYAVAWYSGNDYRDIASYNNLPKPYTIYAGQVLKLRPTEQPSTKVVTPPRTSVKNTQKRPKMSVDRAKKQAYPDRKQVVNSTNKTQSKSGFPAKIDKWVWPAKGKLIETFSLAESGNKGIDIAAEKGSKVVAAAAGKVVYSGNALRGYGNLVIIKHTDAFLSAYAHNDSILVKERQWVDAGESIATVGKSGTDSVRLHFEVRYRGKSLDPLRYLPRQ